MFNEVEKYLTGKRVVIVGPSSHLIGTRFSKVIDSYDVVCRINDVIPKDYVDDYGHRTDIAFYNCTTFSLNWYSDKLKENESISKNIKYVICPVIKFDHDFSGDGEENFKSINSYGLKFCKINKKQYESYRSIIGVEPNSGIVSLLMLLEYPIAELLVTGFSFYIQGNKYEQCYYDGHVKEKYKEKNFNPWEGHDQRRQLDFFKKIVLTKYFSIVKIDSYMNENLGLNHFQVVNI